MDEKIGYYAIIPANVRYDTSLPANAKLLYGEITALCNQEGYCWATNEYFANLYSCGKQAVSRWLSRLKDQGYIDIKLKYKDGSKQIESRYITICEYPMVKKDHTYSQKSEYPMVKKAKENNTSINNTLNNTKKYIKRGYDSILSSVEDEELRGLYYRFIEMRDLIKAPMTDRALQILINKVNELEPNSIERQKKLLETAIVNNWKSVYPLKEGEKCGIDKGDSGEVHYGIVL